MFRATIQDEQIRVALSPPSESPIFLHPKPDPNPFTTFSIPPTQPPCPPIPSSNPYKTTAAAMSQTLCSNSIIPSVASYQISQCGPPPAKTGPRKSSVLRTRSNMFRKQTLMLPRRKIISSTTSPPTPSSSSPPPHTAPPPSSAASSPSAPAPSPAKALSSTGASAISQNCARWGSRCLRGMLERLVRGGC